MPTNNREQHSQVKFFTGSEVEHTPVYGHNTLFVVGLQPLEDVLTQIEFTGVTHVYLGADGSYFEDEAWDKLVFGLVDSGIWVTLDFDIKSVEWILESGYAEYSNFIPMISAKLPYIQQLGYNACLKIDDKEFEASNHGVWVHRVHDLMDKSVFTPWRDYTNDEIVK